MLNRYKSASSASTNPDELLQELAAPLRHEVAPSLVVVFASTHFADGLSQLTRQLSEELATENLIGCTGESIVVDGREIEIEPCVSVWAAWWPSASVEIDYSTFDRADGSFVGLPEIDESSALLILADPFSFPTDVLLDRINQEHPGVPIIGGMASGSMQPGESRIVSRRGVKDGGAVIATLRNVPLSCVVSQGCRPIGNSFVITKAERNIIFELGGHPAHVQLKATYDRLPNRDKELMRQGIHLGRVVNEYQESFDYGDFLIRNVTGFDPEDGSISVGDYYRAGQTVQFHLRDAQSASEDLAQMLGKLSTAQVKPQGALLFTCNGRGTRLFETANHDAEMIQSIAGEIPCAGFFCAGEIGPIGKQNFLHGFTASVAIFE